MATQKKAAGKAASGTKKSAAKSTTKKSTANKPATKKPAAKKPAARKSAPKSPVAKEIIALMDRMSEDALAMLKRQAEVLAYAEELEAARTKMKEAVDRSIEERKAAREAAAQEAPPKAAGTKVAGDETYIDQNGPSSFFIGARGKRIFFSREELRNLTRISHGAEDALAGARRIFTWMERERQDFLTDTGISQPGDKSLQRLWDIIVTTYKVS